MSKFDPEFAAGIWPCTVLSGGVGEKPDKNNQPTGIAVARVNVRFDEGPDKGRLVTYEDEVTSRSSLYIMRSLKNIGWQGRSMSTVAADIEKWIRETGGKSTVEIRHIEIKKGKRYDEWLQETGGIGKPPIWAKANSIGRGSRPLVAPRAEALSDADEMMRRAAEAEGSAPPQDDVPHAAGDPDDIPFATLRGVSLGEIAKVLR